MEVASRDDWCSQEGDIQNSNNKNMSNGRAELSTNIQRCFRCSKPLYYDRLSLIQHNLTHLSVILEKLPDEIFQFYEPDQTAFVVHEKSESSLEINPCRNTDHSDMKSEIEDIQSQNNNDHVFDGETQNKVTESNNNVEFTMRRNEKHIDRALIKFEIEELKTENRINEFLDEEQLNKNKGPKSNNKPIMERNLQHFFSNIIKFEIDEISMDQIFGIEKSTKDVEHNNNIEPIDTRKEQQHECNDSIMKSEVDEINLDSHSDKFDIGLDNSIDSETKRQLQSFDGSIIKCEIEEIHSDNSMEQFEDIENTRIVIEDDNNSDIEKKQRQNRDCKIIKAEIEESNSEDSMDSFVDVENTVKHTEDNSDIDIGMKYHQQHSNSPTIKSDIKEINTNNSTELLDTKNKKKVKKNKDKVAKLKKEPRQCQICKKFISYKHLGQHVKEIHTQNEIECEICEKVFKCKKNMRTHMKNVHSSAKDKSLKIRDKFKETLTFSCDHCKNIFYSKDCLQKHMKNVHGKAVKCDICGSRLGSEIYLSAHIRRVHYDDGKVHSCDICGKIFKSPRYVRVHMKNAHCVSSKRKVSTKKVD